MRKSLAFVLGCVLMALTPAYAQQFIPKPPPPPDKVPVPAQIVPEIEPRATPPEACALAPIEGAELRALRSVILELLAQDKVAQADFLRAEATIPGDCTRRRAVFYMQALARIKAG